MIDPFLTRLRTFAASYPEPSLARETLGRAADEIERLRGLLAVATLPDPPNLVTVPCDGLAELQRKAAERDALVGKLVRFRLGRNGRPDCYVAISPESLEVIRENATARGFNELRLAVEFASRAEAEAAVLAQVMPEGAEGTA